MKTIRFSLLLLFTMLLFSCSEEDNSENTVDTAMLVGNWTLDDYYYDGNSWVDYPEMPVDMEYSVETSNSDASIEFKSDGSFDSRGTISYVMNYEYFGENMTLPVNGINFDGSGSWIMNGNEISISNQIGAINSQAVNQPDIQSFIIEELTETRLILGFDIVQEGTEEGVDYRMTIKGKQVYSR